MATLKVGDRVCWKVDGTMGTFLKGQRFEVVDVMRANGELHTHFKALNSPPAGYVFVYEGEIDERFYDLIPAGD